MTGREQQPPLQCRRHRPDHFCSDDGSQWPTRASAISLTETNDQKVSKRLRMCARVLQCDDP
jgi:hypothetical protein